MSKSLRIRTTPGESRNIQIKIDQDFDFLEVLSLKITQEDLYSSFCADYGVVVGRVIANEGFGVPNTKVSVFIPISSEDEKNDLIRDLYPFKSVTSRTSQGVRYNLLLSKSSCKLNTPVGTFPTKEDLLNNEIQIEIFEKYYKYTTVTNDAGDYMLFGVPTGQQTIHMDVDLSESGPFAVRPYDFIDSGGYPEKLFESRTKFKQSTNLDTLPQIKSGDKGVDVIPFWGDPEQCQIGITRVDFNTNFNFQPTAIFMGSIFTDQAKNSLTKRCNPKNDMGSQCELRTAPGNIEMLTVDEYVYDTQDPNWPRNPKIKPVSLTKKVLPQGTDAIDENGAWVVTVPMNVGHVVTDEFGNLVPSLDPEKGIATKAFTRFKVGFQEPPAQKKRKTANLIIPALNTTVGGAGATTDGDLPDIIDALNPDLNWEPSTEAARFTDDIGVWKDLTSGDIDDSVFYKDFHEMSWNQIYTLSQYIPKYKKGNNRMSYLGLKGVDECGESNPLPFTNSIRKADILYTLGTLIIELEKFFTRFRIIMSNILFCVVVCVKISIDLPLKIGTVNVLNICFEAIKKFKIFGFLGWKDDKLTDTDNDADPDSLVKETDTCGDIKIEVDCTNGGKCECESGSDCPNGRPIQIGPFFSIPGSGANNTVEDDCPGLIKLNAWECCAKVDLAVARKVLKWTFTDAWLTGSAYLPQFKHKRKIKKDGSFVDKFCGPGGRNLGSDNYKNQACNVRGHVKTKSENRCIVRSPSEPYKIAGQFVHHHQNLYNTGAKDIQDYIYCPETYPTKIVNLGRTDACEDIVDRINRCIDSDTCLLDLWNNSGCGDADGTQSTCYTGTGFDEGYDTVKWADSLLYSSYDDPGLVLVYNMLNLKKSCKLKDLFNGRAAGPATSCNEFELKDSTYLSIREISKIFLEQVFYEDNTGNTWWHPPGVNPNSNQDLPNNVALQGGDSYEDTDYTTLVGFSIDKDGAIKFSPASAYNTSGIDEDKSISDQTDSNHYRNVPYFYFGLLPGKTSLDRLRKEYLYTEGT